MEFKINLIDFSFPRNYMMTLQTPTYISGTFKSFLVPTSQIFWSLNKP